MISALEITDFRCFEHFEARDLARVNLLVGTNNSGKTALLEAIELWAAEDGRHALDTLKAGLDRRGEFFSSLEPGRPEVTYVVRHLVHGHILAPDRRFEITATQGGVRRRLRMTIGKASSRASAGVHLDGHLGSSAGYPANQRRLGAMHPGDPSLEGSLVLHIVHDRDDAEGDREWYFPLSHDDGLTGRAFPRRPRGEDASPSRFVTTHSLPPGEVASLFGKYVLTEEEQHILGVLQIVEPGIERLALGTGDARYGSEHAGIFARHAGHRIPIGSMGDGVWRMLALTLALVGTRGGLLLVDEIDTGLHVGVMAKMWRMVIETAQRLNAQVFATSHSRDCYESLAMVLRELDPPRGTAAIHRMERDRQRTVVLDEQEIIRAAERGLEIR